MLETILTVYETVWYSWSCVYFLC